MSGNDYGIYVTNFTYGDDPLTEVFFKDNNIEDNSNYGFYNGTSVLINAGELVGRRNRAHPR